MAAIDVPSGTATELRPAARQWVSVALAGVAAAAGVVGLGLGTTSAPDGAPVGQNLLGTVATFGLAMSFTTVGLILRRSRPGNPIGWILLLFGVVVALSSVAWAVTYLGALPGGDAALGRDVAWLASVLTFPIWTYLATSLIVRFPGGAAGSRFDVLLLRVTAIACVGAGTVAAIRPGMFPIYPPFSNPIQLPPPLSGVVMGASVASFVVALAPLTIAAWNMVVRYRRSASTVERAQLKWFAFSAALALGGAALYVAIGVLLAPDNEALREATYVVLILAVCSEPVAILVAITRHHLYDIDAIISRTFAYGALTAILAGLYAASMRLFNAVFVAVTGQESEAALVLTTLVLATTFTPIKNRLEASVAKRLRPAGPAVARVVAGGSGAATTVAATATATTTDPQLEALVRRVVEQVLRERDVSTSGEAAQRR